MGYDFVANLPSLPKGERNATSPITLIRSLTLMQHLLFFSGWLAWLTDAIDFFAVSLSVSRMVVTFDRETSKITQSITLTLLFRPLGAVVFGLLSDRFGRKWPLIANLLVVSVLSLGTGFVKTFSQFLAVRSLFGIGMGGIWGLSASTALENMPVEARGLFSGILQQGYAVGYLLIAVFNLSVVPKYDTWRVLFYIAAAFSLGAAVVRGLLPESHYFIERRNALRETGNTMSSSQKTKIFLREAGRALKLHWIRCIYAVLLMTGFNFFSHGSQDLYPTYLQQQKLLSPHSATVATIIGNCGAVVGGMIAGWASQFLGRRITIIICCIWTCVWLPLWLLPTKFGPLSAGAFMVQFGVQGFASRSCCSSRSPTYLISSHHSAWGVIPVLLSELSPVAFRAVWPGVAYQLGNMVSAASSQIESTAGEHLKTNKPKPNTPDYGKVSAILIGVVAAWIVVCCLLGSEDHGAHFEKGKAAFEDGGGLDILDDGGSPTRDTMVASPRDEEKYSQEQQAEYANTDKERVSANV